MTVEKVPGAQLVQTSLELAPRIEDQVPTLHVEHTDKKVAPVYVENDPARQRLQSIGDTAPSSSDHVPALHSSHVDRDVAPLKLE
jgi:hypothetical protein